MAENKILPWAQTGTANVLSDSDYASDVASGGVYSDGVKTGQASSKQANKTWRQATAPGSGLAQFLVDNLDVDVTDADTPATFSSRIANAVLKLAQISPFNQAWASATGGYRKYAIVSDSSGNFWVSTADQNTTVPGASGANWQSLFNGYATQSWADGRYVRFLDDDVNWQVQYVGINKSNNAPWFKSGPNYTFLQPAGDYATNPALNTETTNRTNADTNLQNQINNRVIKTGDTMTGTLNFTLNYSQPTAIVATGMSGPATVGQNPWTPQFISKASNDGSLSASFCARDLVGHYPYMSLQFTEQNGTWHELQFRSDDRLYTASGNVFALESDISNLQNQINGKQSAGNYVIHSEFPCNLSGNGWQKLPSGLIIQWGQNTSGAGTYSFPTTFPNGCFIVNPGNTNTQGQYVDNAFAYAVNNSQFYIATKASNTGAITGYPASWFALGH